VKTKRVKAALSWFGRKMTNLQMREVWEAGREGRRANARRAWTGRGKGNASL
jgi:hypothetical protein